MSPLTLIRGDTEKNTAMNIPHSSNQFYKDLKKKQNAV